ncbi:MAG: hypothetical protein QNI86_08245 [Halieaceae bacterium]|nr:hypothetical protein [Halieaceae bacterium]
MSDPRNRHTPALLLALAIAITGGCKIVIDVPEGGSVTTESGAYSCAETESCEIDVDDDSFEETFVAVPAEDYEFRGWKQRDQGLCQGELERLEPCNISTALFGLNSTLLALLQQDVPFYLEPEFGPASTAEILFPSENSSAVEAFVTVRGIASDVDGIAKVTVNGALATIAPAAGAQTTASGLYTEVDWFLPVSLQTGTNTVVVGVEDGRGEVNPEADTAAIQNIGVPDQFTLDEINDRVIGVIYESGFLPELTSYDLATKTQTVVLPNLFIYPPYCYQADTSEFFYLTFGTEPLALRSVNTETLEQTEWATINIDLEAEGFDPFVFYLNLVCESGDDDVYLLYGFSDTPTNNLNTLTNSRVVKFDLGANEVRLLEEFDTRAGDASALRGAKLMGDQLVVYPFLTGPMFSIDTETGERTRLPVRDSLSANKVVTDAANNKLYVINFSAIYEVDLNTGRERILSFVQDSSPFNLGNPADAFLDANNNRILIGDTQLDMILQVNLFSGERSELVTRRQGEGVGIIFARKLYLTSDKRTAYVLDDGGNATERLLKVDLATGDRTQIGNLALQFNGSAAGLAVDEEAGVAYAAFSRFIYRVDLETEQVVEVVGNSATFGPIPQDITDLVLDKAGNRLLFADSQLGAIIELDLRTRVRKVLSQAGEQGTGDPFAGVNALALDTEGNRLFASNRQSGNIMSIDMESGDRSVLLDACLDASGQDQLGNRQSLQGLLYRDGELLILDDGLLRFSPDTGKCAVLRDRLPISAGILDIQWLNDQVLLTSGFGAVGLIDTVTWEFVRISE